MPEDLHYTIKKPGLSIAPHREHGHVFAILTAQFNFLNFLAVFTV